MSELERQTRREYRDERRLEARVLGRAILRTADGFGTNPSANRALIYRAGGYVYASTPGSPPAQLTPTLAHELLARVFDQDQGDQPLDHLLFADRRTRDVFNQALQHPKFSDQDLKRNARGFRGLLTAETLITVRVLSDILSFRYWLPAGMDTQDLTQWREALGVPGLTDLNRTLELEAKVALEGVLPTDIRAGLTAMERIERSLYASARWTMFTSEHRVFQQLASHKDRTDTIRAHCAGLQEELSRNGELTKVRLDRAGEGSVIFELKGMNKHGAGKTVIAINAAGVSVGHGEVLSVDLRAGGVFLTVKASGRSNLARGVHAETNYYLMAKPFTGTPSKSETGRWGTRQVGDVPLPPREMPAFLAP